MNKNVNIKWIGLAKVIVLNESDIFDGDKAAYSNALAFAKNKIEFRKQVKNKLYSMDLKLVRLQEAEAYTVRLKKYKVSSEITKIASRLSEYNKIEFSTFHTY